MNSNELDEGAIGNKMLNILITIKEQNNQILAHIRNTQQARSVVTFTLPENLPLHLPLKTSEDVNLLEEYINDETNCSNLLNIEYIFSLFFYVAHFCPVWEVETLQTKLIKS